MFRIKFALSALFALLLLIAGAAGTHAQNAADNQIDPAAVDAVSATGWYRLAVDTSPDVTGESNAIAVNASGQTYISYYDTTTKELRLAIQVTPQAGNCGSYKAWSCTTVDSAGDTGQWNAIAIHPVTGRPAIAYVANGGAQLKYAEASACTDAGCTCAFTTVEQFGGVLKVDDVDLVFSPNDNHPHIAYTVSNPNAGEFDNYRDLRYATFTGSGATCSANGWTCDVVDAGGRAIIDMSLGLNGSNRPQIVYSRYDKPQNNSAMPSYLSRAAFTVNSGNCGPKVNNNPTWTCADLLTYSDYHPLTVDLATEQGEPRIAYSEYGANTLNYMVLDFQDLNGNCGPSNQWHCVVIDNTGSIGDVSIAMHGSTPLIAYVDHDDFNRMTLKFATPTLDPGNCGPNGGLFDTWQCTTIDNGSRGLGGIHEVGSSAAIADNAAHDYPQVAYGDKTAGDLNLIQQHTPAPVVTSLGVTSIKAGSGPITFTVTGLYFDDEAWGIWGGVYAPTLRDSATKVEVTVDLAANTAPGQVQVKVCNPPFPLTDCSNSLPVTVEKADDNGGGGGGGSFAVYLFLPTIANQ